MNRENIYTGFLGKYQSQIISIKGRLRKLSIARFVLFVGSLAVFFFLVKHSPLLAVISLLVASFIFGKMVNGYNKWQKEKQLNENLAWVNESEVKALKGDFSSYAAGAEFTDPGHDYSYDLDFFGQGSIFQYINRTATIFGRKALKNWLLNPLKNFKEVKERQKAIKELSEDNEWRQKYFAKGILIEDNEKDIEDLNRWLKTDPIYYGNSFYKYIRYIMPLIVWVCCILFAMGKLYEGYLTYLCIVPLIIAGVKIKHVNKAHNEAGKRFKTIMKYAGLIESIEEKDFKTPYTQKLISALNTNQKPASFYIHSLAKRMGYADSRLNLLVFLIGTIFFMWDIWVIYALEKCKEEAKNDMLNWFGIIGQFEALNSLATFHFNNPDFCFPLESEEKVLDARQLGHPLLHQKERVNNNFSLNRKGSFTIITGPNMAGKSTFLRTIGINFILAMIGAPVCAKEMGFQFFDLFSSMRTSDSLSKHESYFYAEIKRLKTIVDKIQAGDKVFIILDEILKGTNSHDKQQGSKQLLQRLANDGGTGVIATHDLMLGELASTHKEAFNNKSFEMEIKDGELHFDFILNEGITTKMNAEYLMKSMGLLPS